jgi:2,5-diamino-6-(ribosylamino)-4(3H)-pyrimidinone 5'-phosphate reductase
MDEIRRPRVVVSVTATADGRVALNRAERLLDPDAGRRWRSVWPPDVEKLLAERDAWIEQRHRPEVILEGSGTFVGDDAATLDLPAAGPGPDPREDFLEKRSPRWFAVVDGRGRIAWTHKQDGDTSLLVVVCESTPPAHLSYLRREGIPYLVGGVQRVDLAAMLVKMGDLLGAGCVVSHAGGGLNGALVRAGLVDELHVVTVPALAGGLGTPSVTDGTPLDSGSAPVRLTSLGVTVGGHGSVWSRYEVSRT